MADSDSTKSAAAAPTRPEMPVFTNAEAMQLLWYHAAEKLHRYELEWFATNAATTVGMNARHLSDTLLNLGDLVIADGKGGHFATPEGAGDLILNVASQLSTMAGLSDIAADAASRLRMLGEPA